jgi:acyl-CoA thioester hydrolase
VTPRHEKTIEIRWRDLDDFGHVNNAVYLTYLEEARDEWVELTLGARAAWDFVLAHVSIDFRRELRQEDDFVLVSCELQRISRSSILTREVVRTAGGQLSAEAEVVLVARDAATGHSRPISDDERSRLEAVLAPE